MASLRFRAAGLDDAESVAMLHADSWRRHYRGAYSDVFLDGDIVENRRSVWADRLSTAADHATILAEDDAGLVGFVHVVFDNDDRWGSLLDNLHVTVARKRSGIGTELMTRAARAVTERAATRAMYLWVLEQNIPAQQLYQALGGANVERRLASPPRGAARTDASPECFRIWWPEAAVICARRERAASK